MLPVVGAEPKDGGSFAGSIEMRCSARYSEESAKPSAASTSPTRISAVRRKFLAATLGRMSPRVPRTCSWSGQLALVDHRDRAVGAVVRQQFLDDLRQVGDAQVDRQGRPVPRQVAPGSPSGIFVRAA